MTVLDIPADATDITPYLVAAAAVSDHLYLPARATPYPLTSKWTATGIHLEVAAGAQISNNLTDRAMELTACTLTNAYFTSTYTAPLDANAATTHPYEARAVILHDGCVVNGYYHEYAAAGLGIFGSNISASDISVAHIRQYEGWGSAIHSNGTAQHCTVSGVTVTDCDRALEAENGASYNTYSDGVVQGVGPIPYTGQPGNFATYTFVLDAHSHAGEGACAGNTYSNFRLVDCMGGITCVRSSGSNDSDLPVDNSWSNITIEGRVGTTGYQSVYMHGNGNSVTGLRLLPGSGVTTMMQAVMDYGANVLEIDEATAYAAPVVRVNLGAVGSSVVLAWVSNPLVGSDAVIARVFAPQSTLSLGSGNAPAMISRIKVDASATGAVVRYVNPPSTGLVE